ncbi:DUF1570 domain-containing protein [Microbulbifer sp. OS29]|uniref:DUF1570 domain-containing protein n=1 Tax=Microbulbifer okhotskensis TaxID=2926617 RepID=A0A9X2EMC1_9GAMM|nr:DUF1570 domain-containing protein [Microbulbifer okhotskensis]MCO1334897.1 DUF1570 domain-containing protein [Microbulbifer okhotskensis]
MKKLKNFQPGNFYIFICIVLAVLSIFGCTSTEKLINSDWYEVETEHFRIVTNDSPRRVNKLAVDLERFRYFAQRYINFSPDQQKLTIYALSDRRSFEGFTGDGNARRTIGRFQNTSHGSFAVMNLKGNRYLPGNPARQTLFHEYTHFLTYSGSQHNYPYWFSEGIAEVFSTVEFGENKEFSVGKIPVDRAISLHRADEMPLEKLLTAVPGSLKSKEVEALYASGWMLTHWLIFDSERNKALGKYLEAYNTGADPVSSFSTALGLPLDVLNNKYKELPKKEFNYFEGELVIDNESESLSTRPLNNSQAIAEIAHFMAITGQGTEALEKFITYAEKKQFSSPELKSSLVIAAIEEEDFSRAREILASIPEKYHREVWYLEASTKAALSTQLARSEDIDPAKFKNIRDHYVELINSNGDVPAYWYELAITMQVLGYPRQKYTEMLEQAYLRAPRDPDIAWWYAHELYLNRDRELFSLVTQPLLMQATNQESRVNLQSMAKEIEQAEGTSADWLANSSGLGQLLSQYRKLSGSKALAIALDYRGAFVAGYMEQSTNQSEANQIALQACEEQRIKYQVRDRCELYAEGELLVDPSKAATLFSAK